MSDETILGSRDRLDIAMPSNADSLAVAEEIDSDGILRDAVRHTGDLSRKQLHDLTIGEELEGKIVSLELYHGALVDCGCETDGLIPISEDDWPDLVDTLTMGTKVKVKVKAVHERWWRFRFPIELDILSPNVGHLIKTHPHEDGPPINIYSGETVPYANMDAGRPLDKFFEVSDVDEEEEERLRVQAISDWVDEKMAETEQKTTKKGNRMQGSSRQPRPRRLPPPMRKTLRIRYPWRTTRRTFAACLTVGLRRPWILAVACEGWGGAPRHDRCRGGRRGGSALWWR